MNVVAASKGKKRSRFTSLSEINIIPLVDITMVLLIIFMLSAPIMQSGIEVRLPQASAKSIGEKEGLIVTITKERGLFLGDERITQEEFEKIIVAAHNVTPEKPVYLRADQDVPYGFVIETVGRIKKAGVSNLGLVVELPKSMK